MQGKKTHSHVPDLQRWQMREEVIPHKEAHEDPVINTPFKIKSERQAGHRELSLQILQHIHTHRHKKKELREHSTGFKWHSQQAAAAPHLSQDAQADEDEFLFRDRQGVRKLIVLKQRGLALDPSASQSFSSPTPKACFERS